MDKLTATEWRYVDIANHAGIKGTFKKRIAWTEKHLDKLESKCDDQLFQASVHALKPIKKTSLLDVTHQHQGSNAYLY